MADGCLLCYITDRNGFPGNEADRREHLLEKIREAVLANIDYIQLREKDLTSRELELLAREAMRSVSVLRNENRELRTKLLVNSRADIALVVQADGIHLRSDDISAQEVRAVWSKTASSTAAGYSSPSIGVSCHSPEEVARAKVAGATFAVFAPVFEKKDSPDIPAAGLGLLREASKAGLPVLALGGITLANAPSCFESVAAGIAAIRLFQENNIAEVVHQLRRDFLTRG
jgi:thiamine-phosphate pyrophosphorylase